MNDVDAILHAAEDVVTILRQHRVDAVVDDAVRLSSAVVRAGSPLRLVPFPQLIALKLYAGGHKSKADVVELLARNPDCDLDDVRRTCARYCLAGLDELIEESGISLR